MLELFLGLALLGGVTSQSLLDASTFCILFYFLKEVWQKKISFRSFQKIGIEWAFLGYFIVAVISLFINGKAPVPWPNYLNKFSWVINLYLYIYAFNRIEFRPQRWLLFFAIAFLIPDLYALVNYFRNYDYLTKTIVSEVIGMVNSSTYHAHGNSMIFVFFTALYVGLYRQYSLTLRLLVGMGLILMGLGIFFTFTRGIWGAVTISLLIFSFLLSRKSGYLFTVLFAVVGTSAFLGLERVRHRILDSFGRHSDNLRLDLLQVHIEMFKEHPWFGIGYWDSYRQIADYWPRIGHPATYFESHAHNQLVNVLATTGLFGLFFFTAIMLFFFRLNLRAVRSALVPRAERILFIALLIVQIDFALACLTDVSFEYAKIRGIFVISLAALVSFYRRALGSQKDNLI